MVSGLRQGAIELESPLVSPVSLQARGYYRPKYGKPPWPLAPVGLVIPEVHPLAEAVDTTLIV